MNSEDVLKLFNEDKILARAMELPMVCLNARREKSYDFTIWAEEVDIAKNDRLTCLSSTLLVAGESIPTYKSIGFLVDSRKAEIVHVAEMDSGSSGNIIYGNFSANHSDIHTLQELADKTHKEKLYNMNEVNINIKDDALIGLFFNQAPSDRNKAWTLLAQEYYKMQTGTELPIFVYNAAKGTLQDLKITNEEKKEFLIRMRKENQIRSLSVYYDLDSDYTHETKQTTLYADNQNNNTKISINDIIAKYRAVKRE
ncbi:MAG: hypothetical protein IJ689_03895 [Alphaproteobacteria bacterium]|nr:hypothetical protein [Alphaproteobacteria bacterium]